MWMINHEIIIKLKNINTNEMSDDVNEMFKHIRLSKENLFIDFMILHDFQLYALFKKALRWIIMYTNKRVDP